MKFLAAILLVSVSTSAASTWKRQGTLNDGATCTTDASCKTGACVYATQSFGYICGSLNLRNSISCWENRQCQSGYCPDGTSQGFQYQCRPISEKPLLPIAYGCQKDADCQSGYCPDVFKQCRPPSERPPADGSCTSDADCNKTGDANKACLPTLADPSKLTCQSTNLVGGAQCVVNSQCQSGTCLTTTTHTCTGDGPTPSPIVGNPTPVPGTPTPQTVTATAPGGSVVTIVAAPTTVRASFAPRQCGVAYLTVAGSVLLLLTSTVALI